MKIAKLVLGRAKTSMLNVLMLCLLIFSVLILNGCGGGGAATYYMHRNTTTGQELSDLQAAYQKGALTEDEYLSQKNKILKGEVNRVE